MPNLTVLNHPVRQDWLQMAIRIDAVVIVVSPTKKKSVADSSKVHKRRGENVVGLHDGFEDGARQGNEDAESTNTYEDVVQSSELNLNYSVG
jgi:hypothetical protein